MSEEIVRPQAAIEGMETVRDYDKAHLHYDEHLTEAERQMREEELSFYSNSENEFGDDNIWGLLSGVGGNIYEWWVNLKQSGEDDYWFRMLDSNSIVTTMTTFLDIEA
jgi:hypothetical protein